MAPSPESWRWQASFYSLPALPGAAGNTGSAWEGQEWLGTWGVWGVDLIQGCRGQAVPPTALGQPCPSLPAWGPPRSHLHWDCHTTPTHTRCTSFHIPDPHSLPPTPSSSQFVCSSWHCPSRERQEEEPAHWDSTRHDLGWQWSQSRWSGEWGPKLQTGKGWRAKWDSTSPWLPTIWATIPVPERWAGQVQRQLGS